jgi:hypothetical protein
MRASAPKRLSVLDDGAAAQLRMRRDGHEEEEEDRRPAHADVDTQRPRDSSRTEHAMSNE